MIKTSFKLLLTFFFFNSTQAWADFDAKSEKITFNYINQLRAELRLTPLKFNQKLHQAARRHAQYDTANDIQGHYEKPTHHFYTGKTPSKRAYRQGYHSAVGEVVSYNAKYPQKYVDDLMSAIYHRLGLLSMTKTEMGVGIYRDHKGHLKSTFVADIGNHNLDRACQKTFRYPGGTVAYRGLCNTDRLVSKADYKRIKLHTARQNPQFIMWPKSGATVPPVFYEEDPDPLPQCNVSGYPVHIQINPELWGKVSFVHGSFKVSKLVEGRARPVHPIRVFSNQTDPNHEDKHAHNQKWLVFFPAKRLDWNSRYQAEVKFIQNGRLLTSRWNFYTPSLPNLKVITHSQTFKVKPHQTLTFYLPPQSCRAPMSSQLKARQSGGLQFRSKFIDTQTFQVTLGATKGQLIFEYLPTHTQIKLDVQ